MYRLIDCMMSINIHRCMRMNLEFNIYMKLRFIQRLRNYFSVASTTNAWSSDENRRVTRVLKFLRLRGNDAEARSFCNFVQNLRGGRDLGAQEYWEAALRYMGADDRWIPPPPLSRG